MTFDGHPTLGWEATALSVSTGQSFRMDRRAPSGDPGSTEARLERPWDRRAYVVWEPGYAAFVGPNSTDAPWLLVGGGFSAGRRWDVREVESADGEVRDVVDAAGIAGFWAGANDSVPMESPGCGGFQPHMYGSVSIGVRGNEIYVTPKLGVFLAPRGICLDLGL
jgi:hypothetical protein